MGLDNIPHVYPCKRAETAIRMPPDEDRHRRIDCAATQAAGGCPLHNDPSRPSGQILGMFGTDCWWRGKAGNWMLQALEAAGYSPPEEGFYGDDPDDSGEPWGTPEYAKHLADWMADHAEAFAATLTGLSADEQHDEIESYRYAIWWLRFVAEHADGFDSWY